MEFTLLQQMYNLLEILKKSGKSYEKNIYYINTYRNYIIKDYKRIYKRWIFFSFKYPNVNLNYGKKQMISILENALSQTNQDEQLETLKLLKDFIKQEQRYIL